MLHQNVELVATLNVILHVHANLNKLSSLFLRQHVTKFNNFTLDDNVAYNKL